MRARLDEVVPADHLATDEPARDVGVDGGRRFDRRLPAAKRPCARLLLACREERDQVERLREPAYDLAEGGLAAAAELGCFLVRKLRELCFELQVDAVRPVLDRDQRLRRQRLEHRRNVVRPVGEVLPGVEMREQALELGGFPLQRLVARLRLLGDALEAALDVVAVRDEQLELERLEIVRRHAGAREAVEDDEERVDLAQVAEQLGPGAANLGDPNRGRRHLPGLHHVGELLQARIGDRRHPDLAARTSPRERLEQHGLPGARQPHDPDFEGRFSVLLRELLLQRRERAVLERLDRALGVVEDLRNVGVREVEDELQGQDLLLLG